MKWLARTIAVVITMSLASVAFAQDAKAGDTPAGGEKKRLQRRDGQAERMKKMRAMHEKRVEALGLSDEQKTKQKEIQAGVEASMKELKTKREALMEQMKAAREAKDEEKTQSLREEFKKLLAAHREVAQNAHKQFEELLTDEQKAKMKAGARRSRPGMSGRPGMPGPAPFAALKLTDEQHKQIRAIMEAAHKKVHDEVLTDEQRDKAKTMREKHSRRRGPGKKPEPKDKPEGGSDQ